MPTPNYPYMIGATAVTIVVDNKPFTFTSTEAGGNAYLEVVRAIRNGASEDQVLVLCDHYAALRKAVAADTTHAGRITFDDNNLLVDGVPVQHDVMVAKLKQLVAANISLVPWLKLIENIWANPAPYARDEFMLWFEQAQMPITPDGCFIAYKRVRGTYFDIHSNTIEYRPGLTVEMDRSKVDPDRHRTCSAGLHFCSRQYLPHFSSNGSTDRVVLVKINPADVVSIPSDYNNAKGRAWRMQVVGEVPLNSIEGLTWDPVCHDYDDDTAEEAPPEAAYPMTPVDAPKRLAEVWDSIKVEHLNGNLTISENEVVIDIEDLVDGYDIDLTDVPSDGMPSQVVMNVGDNLPNGIKLIFISDARDMAGWYDPRTGEYAAGCTVKEYQRAVDHCLERLDQYTGEGDMRTFYLELLSAIIGNDADVTHEAARVQKQA